MALQHKIETFLIEGSPYGLRYHDLSNWIGRIFFTPRTSFSELLKREEMAKPGVYILVGSPEENALPTVYIGEADVLQNRLRSHVQKDFWDEVIVCIAKDDTLDKAGVRYIESKLVVRAQQDKLCDVENSVNPATNYLSEANTAVMDQFIENMIFMLPLVGLRIIRTDIQDKSTQSDNPLLTCDQDGIKATGRDTDEGFIVYKGSTARKIVFDSFSESSKQLRSKLIETSVLVDHPQNNDVLLFEQDYVFSSPSGASGMILGVTSNGRWKWKTPNGTSLKDFQENNLPKI
ncbi:DUF4357 domain-containing protein [candidate division WWE3 bacterium CG_4_9_14_3_um_filter_39_7]|uniref:DUF4357 domain-containing protein n=1 Tax=candidate division WWE3 bacterium CG_4_9_14_3_um_filter_39_7 TaxID=1975080 RepID=A0A2M7X561_UNCKA|nr:MAG: DUF4357 domain-containing protein [candidate division WWE3 bacterium CG_4_9_14_3_um_filter_39_7]